MGESESSGVGSMLKARERNMLEDLKLQREMTSLDIERRHMDKVMYNDMFEQRRVAYKLKQEVADIKKRSEKEMKRRTMSRALLRAKLAGAHRESLFGNTVAEPTAGTGKRKRLESNTSIHEDQPSKNMLPAITSGNSRKPSMISKHSVSMPALPVIRDDDAAAKDNEPSQPPTKAKVRFLNVVKKVVMERAVAREAEPHEDGINGDSPRDGKTVKKASWASVIDRLFPKRPPLVPLGGSDTVEDDSPLPGEGEPVMVLTDFWVGDPKAINSVRRPRKCPEDLNNREKSIGEVRKLIRDMPRYPSCSRNCNRPGAVLDSIASSMPVYNLPALAKLHMGRKSLSVDVLTLDDAEKDAVTLPDIQMTSPTTGREMLRQTEEKRKTLVKMSRKLGEDFRKATTKGIFRQSQVADSSGRVQVTYTYGGTRLRKATLKA